MVKQLKKVPYCGRPQGPLPPSLCPHLTLPPLPRLCGRPLWTAPIKTGLEPDVNM